MGWDGLTVPNDGNFLAFQVIRPVPSRRMHYFTLEILDARDVGFSWHVELANGRHEEVGRDDIVGRELAVLFPRDIHLDLPLRLLIIPAGFFDGGVESDVPVEVVLLSRLDEVRLKVRL